MNVLRDDDDNGLFDLFEFNGLQGNVDEDVNAGMIWTPEPEDENASRETQVAPADTTELATAIDAIQNVTATAESTMETEIGESEDVMPMPQATTAGTT